MSRMELAGEAEIGIGVARDCYRDIPLYKPDRAPCQTDLSDNTNLWGVPPRALAALRSAGGSAITRYPDLYATRLKEALARYSGLPEEMIATGSGSDDVLDVTFRAFGKTGDACAHPDPSFPMIPLFARMNGMRPVSFRLDENFDVDPEEVLATGARVIYLCWPNNPTGTLISRDALEQIVVNAPGVVVLDEAYWEFAGSNNSDLLAASDRLIIVRTMSKAFGMAGIRIGYALAAPHIRLEIEKSRGPYKINALAELGAVTAIDEDMEWVQEHVAEAVRNRERFTSDVAAMEGYEPIVSHANFVLIRITDPRLPPAGEIARLMRERGVAIRPFARARGLGDCIRASIGPWPLMQRCLDAMPQVTDTVRAGPSR